MAVNLSMPRSAQICPAVRVRKSTITNTVQNIWIMMINFLNYIHEYLVLKPPSLKAVLSFTQEQDQCMVMTERKVTFISFTIPSSHATSLTSLCVTSSHWLPVWRVWQVSCKKCHMWHTDMWQLCFIEKCHMCYSAIHTCDKSDFIVSSPLWVTACVTCVTQHHPHMWQVPCKKCHMCHSDKSGFIVSSPLWVTACVTPLPHKFIHSIFLSGRSMQSWG